MFSLSRLRGFRASGPGWGYLCWVALLASFISPGAAWAFPEGGGRLGFSYYSLRFRTLGEQFSLSEAYGFLDLFQNVPNYGVLEGRLAYSRIQEPPGPFQPPGWRQAYGRLSLKNYRWGRGVMALTAGDDAFTLSNLSVKFTSIFYPLVYYRGFGLQYAHPYFQVYLLGGEVTRSRGLAGETFTGLGESLYGVMGRFQPYERLLLETNFYLTRDEKDFTGNLVTKSNRVFRVAGQWRVWSQLYSMGEFMQSFSTNPHSQEEEDLAYRAGGLWRSDRLRLEANYRYFGPRFHLINEIFQPERSFKGYYVAGEGKPWPFLSVFGTFDAVRNFVIDPAQSLTETETRSLGAGFYRVPWPSLYVRYYESYMATRADFPVAIRGRIRSLYSEASKKINYIDIYGRYERFQYLDEINPDRSYRKDAPVLGVRGFHRKFLWYVEGEYDRFTPTSAGQGFEGLYLRVGGNYFASPNWSIYGELSYRPSSRRYAGQLGFSWNLPHGFRARGFGRWEKGTIGTGDFVNNFNTNQVILEIVKTLSWGKKLKVAGLKPGQEWLGSGKIEGYVFNDVNVNQSLDARELGVEGIKVRLEDGSTTVTDRRGYYEFLAVAAGKHIVTLESRKIPAAFTFEGAETAALEVKRRATARMDFPFVRGASIRGRVVEDIKGLGKPAPDAKGIPDVLVLLKPGDLNTYTDSEGFFAFEGLVPKEYEVSLLAETLPEHGQLTSAPFIKVSLTPGSQVRALVFAIHRPERPIIFK